MNKEQQRKRMNRSASALVQAVKDFHRVCGIKSGLHGTSITTRTVNGATDYTILVDGIITFTHTNKESANV